MEGAEETDDAEVDELVEVVEDDIEEDEDDDVRLHAGCKLLARSIRG